MVKIIDNTLRLVQKKKTDGTAAFGTWLDTYLYLMKAFKTQSAFPSSPAGEMKYFTDLAQDSDLYSIFSIEEPYRKIGDASTNHPRIIFVLKDENPISNNPDNAYAKMVSNLDYSLLLDNFYIFAGEINHHFRLNRYLYPAMMDFIGFYNLKSGRNAFFIPVKSNGRSRTSREVRNLGSYSPDDHRFVKHSSDEKRNFEYEITEKAALTSREKFVQNFI